MEFDVVIVGAGPAGLASAIRLKQINPDINVVVVEKGSEVGAHILSGAVIDPVGLDQLLPEWRDEDTPIKTAVTDDRFYYLGEKGALRLPNFMMPPLMSNHGNFIVSLGNVCRWLADKAEGARRRDLSGLCRRGSALRRQRRGRRRRHRRHGHRQERRAQRLVHRAAWSCTPSTRCSREGARGNLGKQLIAKFGLGDGREPQKFGIGLKELWQVAPDKHRKGLVQHSFGWPLDGATGGGSFLYHFDDNLVSVGFVVHLNYSNPYLSPFEEFQRFKTHPLVRDTFAGGKRLAYGARALDRRRLSVGAQARLSRRRADRLRCRLHERAAHQGQPQRHAVRHAGGRGGGCRACRRPRQRRACRLRRRLARLADRQGPLAGAQRQAAVVEVRHARSASPLGGLDMWTNTLGFSLFGTLKHGKPDYASLKPAAECTPDRLSQARRQAHLRPALLGVPVQHQPRGGPAGAPAGQGHGSAEASEHDVYAGPSARYCPAGVYEWVEEGGAEKYVINAQNCVHCKTCDIKDPNQNITWVPPEGGGGPNYPNM